MNETTDLVGPIALTLRARLEGDEDAILFACLRLMRDGRTVSFEGSYGYAGDFITHGMQRWSHRELDPELSHPGWPVHRHARPEPHKKGDETLEISLLPQATRLRAGDRLILELHTRWPIPTNPVSGQFPGRYEGSSKSAAVKVLDDESQLLMPVRPPS